MNTMLKKQELKKEIEEVLFQSVSTKEMLLEIALNNILIKQKSGNIELFRFINQKLIEKVWRAYKTQTVLEKNIRYLNKIGLSSRKIIQNQELFFSQLGRVFGPVFQSRDENKNTNQNNDDFLEIEIFRINNTNVN